MATTRVKDYTKTVNGKLVFVPAHDQTVHHALGRDFEALLAHPKIQALAPPKPKAPEPEAAKIPAHLLAGVDQDFQDALATIQQHTPAPAKNPAYMNAANDAADASYAAVRAGAAAKTYTEFKEAEMAHTEAAFKHSKAGMSAPPDMQDFHAGKVQEHLNSADAHKSYAESNPPPEPKAAAPAAGPWQPKPEDVEYVEVLHNTEGTSDKVYKVSAVKCPDGTYAVVAQWGKNGAHFAQQVKQTGIASLGSAMDVVKGLANVKMKHHLYYVANPQVTASAKNHIFEPIEGVAQPQAAASAPAGLKVGDLIAEHLHDLKPGMVLKKATTNVPTEAKTCEVIGTDGAEVHVKWIYNDKGTQNASLSYSLFKGLAQTQAMTIAEMGPEEGDVKGALTFHHGRWHATKEVAAPPPAAGPKVGDPVKFKELQVGMVVSSESGHVKWEITHIKGTSAGFKVVWDAQVGTTSIGKIHETYSDTVNNNVFKIVSLPGEAAKPTAAPVVIQDPHEHTGVTGIMSLKKQGDVTYYGQDKVKVIYAMDGLKPSLRIELPKSHMFPPELGAKWMPIAKVWQITLPGTVGASGKKKAMLVHTLLESTMGAAWGMAQIGTPAELAPKASATPQKGLAPGAPTPWESLTVGTKVIGAVTGTEYTVIELMPGYVKFKKSDGTENLQLKTQWKPGNYKQPGTTSMAAPPTPAGPKVGDTKVENGKTYKLNANHKWELVESAIGAKLKTVSAADLSKEFAFKKIGEAKGSNPGGFYEDPVGKKWYIKFPATKEHCENELLANKLYGLLGVEVPKVKLVVKDGKTGIASAIMDGLKADPAALLALAPGVAEGFGADAWLGNWDTMGLTYDNMLIDAKGHAIRIDPGGALKFRAQGTAKEPDEFGDTVQEIETLRNPAKNAKAAAVFGKLTHTQIVRSLVPVLEMPDDVIEKAVLKFGPGTEAQKKALAAKLIARKHNLAQQFPEADLIANPPKPDPTNLQVDASQLPNIPPLANFNSSKKWVNEASLAECQKLQEFALKGNLTALKEYQFQAIDKETGNKLGLQPIQNHPSSKVQTYWGEAIKYLEVLANPGGKIKAYNLNSDADFGSIKEVSEAFPSKPWGVNPDNCDPHENLGYFMALGVISDPESLRPPNAGRHVSAAETSQGFLDYKKWPSMLKKYISAVQSSGNINHAFKGDKKTYGDVNLHQALKEAYQHAVGKPAGTTINRWQDVPLGMYKQLQQVPIGLVFQNTDSMCSSKNPGWDKQPHFDGTSSTGMLLQIHYAEGAKAVDTFGSGAFDHEQEITTLPGQRFVILSRGTQAGKMKLELLMLPPDPTFVDSVK